MNNKHRGRTYLHAFILFLHGLACFLTIRGSTVPISFKSSFETGTGEGGGSADSFGFQARVRYEKRAFSIAPDSSVVDRPVYGYLSDGTKGSNKSRRGNGVLNGYGDISFRLKKDVKRRATFTVDDSIIQGGVLPSPVDNPSYRSLVYDDRRVKLANKVKNTDELGSAYVEAQIHGGVSLSDVDAVFFRASIDLEKYGPRLESLGIKTGLRRVD